MDSREYVDRDSVLLQLGYSSYLKYLRSPLWDLIRREVLYRDECSCCNPKCPHGGDGAKQVHHLSYSRATLLGINPGCLVTLCEGCHKYVEYDGTHKRSPPAVRKLTFFVVSRLTITGKAGRPDPRIGLWWKERWLTNEAPARRIFQRIKRELPDWHKAILLQIRAGEVSRHFVPYLGLRIRCAGRLSPRSSGGGEVGYTT